jgi:LPXTG-motif cell wall-anchored protein
MQADTMTTLPERVARKIEVSASGCWLWTAALDKDGYGFVYPGVGKQNVRAHRFIYESLVAPIPAGLQLDHTCHNDADCGGGACDHRRCVNPAHLEPVTGRVNKLRSPNTANSRLSARTHCARGGHQRWGMKNGTRYCLECARLDRAARVARKRSEAGSATVAGLVTAFLAALLLLLSAGAAGAGEWLKPAEHGYVDLLRVPYDASPGHSDSLHATCAPNGQGVEIAVHPFDGVARSFQVWELSPPAPMLLDNVTEAVWSKVYPFGYYGIAYSGDSSYLLVDEDTQRALCLGPDGDPQPPTTAPPVPSTVPTVPETVPVPVTEVPPPSVTVPAPDTTIPSPPPVVSGPAPSTPGIEVLEQRVTRGELPHTGSSTPTLVALGVGLLVSGASILRRVGRLTDENAP